MIRAKKGGEYGANGDWYEGGKFLNTVADNAKGKSKPKARLTGRVQVAPYTWEDRREGKFPIFEIAGKFAGINRQTGEMFASPEAMDLYNTHNWKGHTITSLVIRYNMGLRWVKDCSK